MYIREERSLEGDKELKVRIPIEQHLKLHSLKVLTGKPISEAVSEALAAYFAESLRARTFAEAPGEIPGAPDAPSLREVH